MMEKIENKILKKIKKAGLDALFFTDDFTRLGTAKAVSKALQRLTAKGDLDRVARGIYARPKKSALPGKIQPGIEEIARAIARRDRARIVPTGALALYQLGLSTQVPLKAVYLTDGSTRLVKIGQTSIRFKKASPKILAIRGKRCLLAIQALRELGKDRYTDAEKQVIIKMLKSEKYNHLEHDIRLAPEWIRKIMREALPSPAGE